MSASLICPSTTESTGLTPRAPPTSATAAGKRPPLCQVLQAVHYGQNADALLELFQLSGNRVRGQVLLVAQAQRFANQDALALGCRAGIHKKDILKIAAFRCQPRALIGARTG